VLNKTAIQNEMMKLNPPYQVGEKWRWMEKNSPILKSKTRLWKLDKETVLVPGDNSNSI